MTPFDDWSIMEITLSYYLLSLGTVTMLLSLFRGYKFQLAAGWLYLVVFLWLAYVYVLSANGILGNFELPPRVPLLVVLPCIIAILWLINRRFMEKSLRTTPAHLPVALQSFRILVELLIYATYVNGIFPEQVTFKGLNFDILVGLSAPVISFLLYRNILKARGLIVWNIISLGVLALTVYAFVTNYYFDGSMLFDRLPFTRFPYILLVSVLLPVAVFLHVFSIRQVIIKKINA